MQYAIIDKIELEAPVVHADICIYKCEGILEKIEQGIEEILEDYKKKDRISLIEGKNKVLAKEYQRLLKEHEALLEINNHVSKPIVISPNYKTQDEAIAVSVFSDWHAEEEIKSSSVNGVNKFNLDIADKSIKNCFYNKVKLIKKEEKDIKISGYLCNLLGDFITGAIHEENLENCLLRPTEAILFVEDRIKAGIDFMLNNLKKDFVFNCASGNHSRTTHKIRHATFNGHSLEYMMYKHLANIYKGEPRVKFDISESYHNYIDVLGYKVRTHHGHDIRYAGGVGGLTIPVLKAIAQWDRTITADIDLFGHFHTSMFMRKYVSNGCLNGYNAYGMSIKAPYEPPTQAFFLIQKGRGITITAPIIVR